MLKYHLVILFVLIWVHVTGQTDPIGSFNRHIFETWKGEYFRVGPYKVKGTPYFFGEALKGSIKYKGARTVIDTNILYDIYAQKAGIDIKGEMFETSEPVEEFSILLPEKFGGQKLLFRNSYWFGKATMNCFFNVLEEGEKLTLLKLFKTALFADPTNTMAKDQKVFEHYYEYYIYQNNDQILNHVKLRKKDIIKELDNDEFIKDYTLKTPVDFTKEAEVVQLIRKYNNQL